jgi:V-type H+-transporting ATPase subunit G
MTANCCSDRAQRLKAAKTDAAKEIEQYKQEKEAEFKKYEAQVS